MSSEDTTIRNDEVRVYEVGYLIVPSVPQEKIGDEVKALTEQITKGGAEIIAHEDPELRPLAYTFLKKVGPINQRFNQAYFGWVKFETEPAKVEALKKWLDEHAHILRYLLTITVRENTYLGKKSSPVIIAEEAIVAPKEDGVAAEEPAKTAEEIVKTA